MVDRIQVHKSVDLPSTGQPCKVDIVVDAHTTDILDGPDNDAAVAVFAEAFAEIVTQMRARKRG